MNEPITPNQLRRLFPGVSKSVLARNPMNLTKQKNDDQIHDDAMLIMRRMVGGDPASDLPVPESPSKSKFSLLMTIAVPNPMLNPNARVHWAQKQRLVRECRLQALLAASCYLGARTPPMLAKATVLVRWFHRTTHRLDATNLIGTLKAVEDGLTDAEIWKDDCGVTWLPPEQFTDPLQPRVELLISEP